MKLSFLGNEYEFDNNSGILESMFNEINSILAENSHVFSHMSIDGKEVMDEHYTYLQENIESIENIRVISIHEKNIIINAYRDMGDLITNIIPVVEKLADGFYQLRSDSIWNEIINYFQSMQDMLQSYSILKSREDMVLKYFDRDKWALLEKHIGELNKAIKTFEIAMSKKDTVYIADLLKFDSLEALKDINKLLNEMSDKEVEKC